MTKPTYEELEQENERLRERVTALEALLTRPFQLPAEWRLTIRERQILGFIYHQHRRTGAAVSVQAIMDGVYRVEGGFEKQRARVKSSKAPAPSAIYQLILKIRRRLEEFGLGENPVPMRDNTGYYLTDGMLELLDRLNQEDRNEG